LRGIMASCVLIFTQREGEGGGNARRDTHAIRS
jgi:hypothetical protein